MFSAFAQTPLLHVKDNGKDGYFDPPSSFYMAPGTPWSYRFNAPSGNWTGPSYNSSSWASSSAPFGDDAQSNTYWNSANIWLRKEQTISSSASGNAVFWGRFDDDLEAYVNGSLALQQNEWVPTNRYLGMKKQGREALVSGSNQLAAYCHDGGGGNYFDVGITPSPIASMPSTGFAIPELNGFRDIMKQYLMDNVIPGGTFAVMQGDEIVANYTFGWKNKQMTTSLQLDAPFRLASIDKPITYAAIRKMIELNTVDPSSGIQITWDTKVYDLFSAWGITAPSGVTPDPRTQDITIRHLIDHQGFFQELPWGGIDGATGKPAREAFYTFLGIPVGASVSWEDNMSYALGKPLNGTPGVSPSLYSSIGYSAVRAIIHKVSGDLENYLKNVVFENMGINDVIVAEEQASLRDPREPWYAYPEDQYDRRIDLPNYFSLAATSEDMVRFARNFHVNQGYRRLDPQTGQWAPIADQTQVVAMFDEPGFAGRMAGSWGIIKEIPEKDISLIVLTSQGGPYDELYNQLYNYVNTNLSLDLPQDWVGTNVGNGGYQGVSYFRNNKFTVKAIGGDIWSNQDRFRFTSQQLTGDGEISAYITAQGASSPWAKAGLMFRESSQIGSKYVLAGLTPGNGEITQYRMQTNGYAGGTVNGNMAIKAPYWVRLKRTGDTFETYFSSNGNNWNLHTSVQISMSNTLQVGLAVSSHNQQHYSIATFEQVNIVLPSGCANVDVNNKPAVPCSVTAESTGQDGALISWVDASNIATKYQIQRRLTGDIWRHVVTIQDGDAESYQIPSGLMNGGEYTFRVKARTNNSGSSWAVSNTIVIGSGGSGNDPIVCDNEDVNAKPAAPCTVEATVLSSTSVELSWVDASDIATKYQIQKQRSGDVWRQVVTLQDGDAESYIIATGLTAGETYKFRVKARTNNSGSAWEESDPVSLGSSSRYGISTINAQPFQVKVFPNPTSGAFQVNISGQSATEAAHIEVYGLTGNLLFRANGGQGLTRVQPHLSTGLYILRVHSGNQVKSLKIRIQ